MKRFKPQNDEHKTTARNLTTIVCYRLFLIVLFDNVSKKGKNGSSMITPITLMSDIDNLIKNLKTEKLLNTLKIITVSYLKLLQSLTLESKYQSATMI